MTRDEESNPGRKSGRKIWEVGSLKPEKGGRGGIRGVEMKMAK